jgi:hypothetical protein
MDNYSFPMNNKFRLLKNVSTKIMNTHPPNHGPALVTVCVLVFCLA